MSELLKIAGQLFLFCLLVIACGAVLTRTARAAFRPGISPQRTARGGRGRALRSPAPKAVRGAARTAGRSIASAAAHPGSSQIRTQARADIRRLRTAAALGVDLQGQRQPGTTVTAARPTLRQRLRLAPYDPGQPDPAAGGANGGGTQPANGTTPATGGNGGPPARPLPPPPAQPAPSNGSNGGTPVPASTASAEKLVEGINEIYSHAATGGIHAKREALAAAHEGATRFAGMMQMLARTMSDAGYGYGPEITEPTAKAGQNFQAGAMTLSEALAALDTLINMTVGDLAKSPRQAPARNELSENGAR